MPGKLHLGCGYHIMPGWVNIDIDSIVADVHLDLRNPIPYSDKSILYIFSEHFIEHLSIEEARIFLRECYRVLVPKGVTLREGCVTGANSLVIKDCDPWTVNVGSPTRVLKKRLNDVIELGEKFLEEYNAR